ncbi:hypothetical protein PCANC_28924 [Puccinia coronata f. sp. avenae]|uniref:No apical meristem-associated C-terminal domain-containing protein n=1 Tax=Puccinia coronata f. sp. avenae TaxID=200324 RepID=A0A2N5RV46_9BASI|nr:hypothetical protein PCANC_28924 [Puccinia coronata f. sp. avenae]
MGLYVTFVRWTALNTATLKFSAIYNAIERNPPSGTGPEDWLRAAHTVYQDQKKGTAFNSVAAWHKVWFAAKWRPDKSNNVILTFTGSSDTFNGCSDILATASGMCTPSVCSSTPLTRPIGQKAAKKRRIKGNLDDEKLMAAIELTEIAKERLESLNKATALLEAKNLISEKRLKLEEKKYLLEEKKVHLNEEHQLIKLQAHKLKMLREKEDNTNEPGTNEVLKMMKKKIMNKWLPPM